ncbi:MAG TPA: GNAT family N-acetyltransferase [Actinomycetes bacterium]|nr:GNAT family N-acetyltransferase [Actinomycetes bacterium]
MDDYPLPDPLPDPAEPAWPPDPPGQEQPAGQPVYRPAREDEHDTVAALMMLGFGQPQDAAGYAERSRGGEFRVLAAGGELVAALRLGRLGQWWQGRRAPSAQVLQLATAIEHRGRGHAVRLLDELLAELHASAVPTVTLFASTPAPYRTAGFEFAGTWTRYTALAEHLPRSTAPYRARRLVLDDLDEVRALYDQVASVRHGALDRDLGWWHRLVGREPAGTALLVLDGPVGPAGWALIAFGPPEDGWRVRISVHDWGCLPGAEPALFALLSGYGPMDGRVSWTGPDPDPALLVVAERAYDISSRDHWMLRVVDVQAALAARAYPEALRGTVRLRVEDPRCPWNTGAWLLEVSEGRGRAERITSARPRLDARGLAALFTGFQDPESLAAAGLLAEAQPRELSFLRAAFCSRRPWVAEHY